MLGIARLADRGPMMAAFMAASLLGFAVLVPLLLPIAALSSVGFVIGSAAVVAFVILRRGEMAAIKSAGFCIVLLITLSMVLSGSAVGLPLVALIVWLPALLSAIVLRRIVRLDVAVLVACISGALAAVAISYYVGGDGTTWREWFAASLGSSEQSGLTQDQLDDLVERLTAAMSWAMVVSIVLIGLCALFLARYWQATMINPGGFQKEFHALSLGTAAGAACVVTIVLAMTFEANVLNALAVALVVAFFMQGLAVAHAVVKQQGLAAGLLVGMYALLLLLTPTILLLAALGLADNVFRLRRPGTPAP